MEKRQEKNRRQQRKVIIFPERRTGFDRRAHHSPFINTLVDVLKYLRNNELLLAFLLILINLLNFGDAIFSQLALKAGYKEANPFLRYLLVTTSPEMTWLIKISVAIIVTLVIWHYRRYKQILLAALLVLTTYLVLFFFHLQVTLKYLNLSW